MFRQNFAPEFVCDNHTLWADHEQNLIPDLRSSDAEVVESPRSSESDFACLINPLEQDPVSAFVIGVGDADSWSCSVGNRRCCSAKSSMRSLFAVDLAELIQQLL